MATQARGQDKVHLLHAGKLPPGAIGAQQLARGGPLAGYFQPVEIKAPQGALVSLAVDDQFSAPQRTPLKVAMLVAPVYRLRVTQIPNHIGEEVYPTVEVINRIYPPVGEEFRFPIPIELTQADLELALAGKFITRVVYLEDPQRALPIAKGPETEQTYFEVRPSDDPLEVADRLGRPVAIIRLGGRLPDAAGPDARFLFGSPPVLIPNSLDLFLEASIAASKPEVEQQTAGNKGSDMAHGLKAALDTRDLARRAASPPKPDVRPSVRLAAARVPLSNEQATSTNWRLDQPAPVAVSVTDE